ncbi:hypothetical protein MUP77_15360 [Candidatus Bathyarchaeota archaeon]|nr:hypothetical protein [Candidatus Bathyarchaeota archaeon]
MMIQSIVWPDPGMNEFRSPFQRGDKERNLRLTLHIESFDGKAGENNVAYSVIRELGELDEIEIFSTQEDTFPWIQIENKPARDGCKNVNVWQEGKIISYHLGVNPTRYDQRSIQSFIGYHSDDEIIKLAEDAILIAEAHHALRRDILVTMSPLLLEHRDKIKYSNIFSPIEAAKLVGLFLRSRDNWVYRKVDRATFTTDKGQFYWVLTRSKLPAMWRYFSGCVHAKKIHGDEILFLGQSILERCKRVLQARDAIAEQFYKIQNNNTQDEIMYHFDYVALLLVGVFDAQATISNYVYGLVKNNFDIGFRRKKFLEALQKSKAKELFRIVTSDHCKHLVMMLHTIRNTVHSAGLSTYALQNLSDPVKSFIDVPENMQEALWQTSQALGTPSEWGLIREENIMVDCETKAEIPKTRISLEPYSYVTKLIDTWFDLFNQIAEKTAIEDLFVGKEVPDFTNKPPDDWISEIERFRILGNNAC